MKKLLIIFLLLLQQQLCAQTVELLATFSPNTTQVTVVRFSPDGKYLISGSANGMVGLWEVATQKQIAWFQAHQSYISDIAFAHRQASFATAGYDGVIKVWDIGQSREKITFFNPVSVQLRSENIEGKEVSFVVFDPGDQLLYFGGYNGQIIRGDLESGDIETLYSTFYAGISCGVLSPDKKLLAFGYDREVALFDLQQQRVRINRDLSPQGRVLEEVCELAFSPDQRQLAVWKSGGMAELLAADSLQTLQRIQASEELSSSELRFMPKNNWLLTGKDKNRVNIWDTGSKLRLLQLEHKAAVKTMDVSSDGRYICTGGDDQQVRLWRVKETAEKVMFGEQEVLVGENIPLLNLLFEQSQAVLLKSSYPELEKLLRLMQQYPYLSIELLGHTDNVGNAALNHRLSERRVLMIKNYLVDKGIDEKRVTVKAFGGTQPVASNDSEEGRKKNRRVEMKLVRE